MRRSRPLVVETLRGLASVGTWQSGWLAMLLIVAGTLLLWWPKQELPRALANGDGPDTLSAVLVALGLVMAYQAMRAGAEEIRFVEQPSLREWVVATPLPVKRIVGEHVLAQLVQVACMQLLALPLILPAMGIAGAPWGALVAIMAALAVHTLAWVLLAGWAYLMVGHRAVEMFIALRVGLGVIVALAALFAPQVSAVMIPVAVLQDPASAWRTVAPLLMVWSLAAGVAMMGMSATLARHRGPGGAGRPGANR